MSALLHEVDEVKYVVKVNGVAVSIPFTSHFLAEQHISTLPMDQQPLAEVVPVTADGQQLLLG